MSRRLKLIGTILVLVVVLVAGLYGYRAPLLYAGRTPEGYKVLTAMPASEGFEPTTLPEAPVLTNDGSGDLDVSFGYLVGKVPYSYNMRVAFPDKSNTGTATLTVRHAAREASVKTKVVRRWDEPRKAYAIALQEKLDIEPAVPSLCIKAVIGPNAEKYDLGNASLCIAQRDVRGTCHPETLACGLIR